MIALPLHGQNTAAVEPVVTGQAGPPILNLVAGGDVFGKQARLVFAEFLPFLLVFPFKVALQCGVNDWLTVGFSWSFCWPHYSLGLGSLISSGWSDLVYTCARRRACLLVTHSSIISSMGAWVSLIVLGE